MHLAFAVTVYSEKIPFVKPAPIEQEELAKQKKQQTGKKEKGVGKHKESGDGKLKDELENVKIQQRFGADFNYDG